MTTIAIRPDAQKLLTVNQEADLLRAAYSRSPNAQIRSRLAILLILEEAFSEAATLLLSAEPRAYADETALASALLATRKPSADIEALSAAQRAWRQANNDAQRAHALALGAQCQVRMGQIDAARISLREALLLDPSNTDACKRIAAVERRSGQPHDFLAIARSLVEKGVNHTILRAEQSLAFASVGDLVAARTASGFDAFHYVERLTPPPGWATITAFNQSLANELLAHPGIRYERYGSAAKRSWRIENPARSDTPLFNMLTHQIIGAVERRANSIGQSDHHWASAMPASGFLRNWCVISDDDGFEDWHFHPSAWLSGVYYVAVPDAVSQGQTKDGCIAFGLPETMVGAEAASAFGEHLVRPQPGMLMTFPAQCFHRTFPHGTSQKRICVAFDVRQD